MKNKGFTLMELLVVIVIFSLVITIVATKGFGIFDRGKEKIQDINKESIEEVAEIIKVEIEYCDEELIEKLLVDEKKENRTCSKLHSKLSEGIEINLPFLIDEGYLKGVGIEEINENNMYDIIFKKDTDDKTTYTINNTQINNDISINDKKATLINDFLSDVLMKLNKENLDINEIHFVNYVKDKTYEVSINPDKSNTNVYTWNEEKDGNNIIYIGSEGKIYAPDSLLKLFVGFDNILTINFENFDTSEVTNMAAMFAECTNLKYINFGENFKTDAVEQMQWMFKRCESLEELDLSGFNTKKVKTMYWMFWSCYKLKTLKINNFNTSKLTSWASMFDFSDELSTIYVKWDNVINIQRDIESTGAQIIKV